LVLAAPPGPDMAAHVYQRGLFAHHGLLLWDNRWYDGRYAFVTYSALYYPLAALVGIKVLAVLSAAGMSGGYALAALGRLGRRARPSVWLGALGDGALVLGSAFPFLLGAAFGAAALALVALPAGPARAGGREGRLAWPRQAGFALAAAACLAASPLAFLGLGIVVAALVVSRPARARPLAVPIGVLGVLALAEAVLMRLFADYGHYPFWSQDLVTLLVLCAAVSAVASRSSAGRPIVAGAGLLALTGLAAFAIPSDLGANVDRVRDIALPVVALAVALARWRPRWLVVPVLLAAAVWEAWPLASAWSAGAAGGHDDRTSYWAPAVAYLRQHLSPSFRVEAVDPAGHWPAAWLAGAGIPLVRGWYRQDDFPANALLYRSGPLAPAAYLAWLRGQGVAYVVLSDAPADFSATGEEGLVRSGGSGLRLVLAAAHVSVYAVPAPEPIVVGPAPAPVTRLTEQSLTTAPRAAGSYRIALHWSPYWRTSRGCVTAAAGGMTELVLRAPGPGPVTLSLGPTPATLLGALSGASAPRCGGPGGGS
ncbi:MAG: hypothetical protein ACRDYD_00980, partial [Acidimicrobiales bacterium]